MELYCVGVHLYIVFRVVIVMYSKSVKEQKQLCVPPAVALVTLQFPRRHSVYFYVSPSSYHKHRLCPET